MVFTFSPSNSWGCSLFNLKYQAFSMADFELFFQQPFGLGRLDKAQASLFLKVLNLENL